MRLRACMRDPAGNLPGNRGFVQERQHHGRIHPPAAFPTAPNQSFAHPVVAACPSSAGPSSTPRPISAAPARQRPDPRRARQQTACHPHAARRSGMFPSSAQQCVPAISLPSARTTPETRPSCTISLATSPSTIDSRRLFCQILLDRIAIQLSVRLRPWPLHGRAFPSVQQPELNARHIGSAAHDAIHRINFTHKMAFAQTANRRIARHHPDSRSFHRDKRCPRSHPCRRRSRFCTRMSTSNDDDVKMFHVKHPHFPMQKLEKISSSRSSTSTRPIKLSKDANRLPQRFRRQLNSIWPSFYFTLRSGQSANCPLNSVQVPRAIDRSHSRHAIFQHSPIAAIKAETPSPVLPDTRKPGPPAKSALP